MKCPVDGTELMMTDRTGVEIDYCPQCRGVWLDRGELDKIIDRSAPEAPPAAPAYDPAYDYDDRDRGYDDKPRKRKKRGGFLEDLFDF
ncbi:hypothetical protein DC366_07095 [Pelagivirga sediminicola]|uniref:Transcription factor zinc-finger domain-containing protein n=1 Tax=Pelagivirga sediminicola TaxID=2170575 RepID=A0A2T7G8B8_9RHOB|nr:zf-TFIIB domain-containing protein [Pelagivirga sediminicola]PVA10646.1 hypothetical protein DC366_07095 [Pelagivirga sediminicola]